MAASAAKDRGAETTVLTFDPHPREFFTPDMRLPRLFQASQKLRALEELGVDRVVVQKFDGELSQLSPENFCKQLLLTHLNTTAIAVGYDFRFGKARTGTLEDFRRFIPSALIQEASEVKLEGDTISSSVIRKYLQLGQIEKANRLLGRSYLLEGVIQKGRQLGRQLGFPTANIGIDTQMLPEPGVYSGFAVLEANAPIFNIPAKKIPCIVNIGYRPTLTEPTPQLLVETHLLSGDYGQDALYGLSMGVYLSHHIRKEQKFNGLDELKAQIQADCVIARKLAAAN